MFFFYRPIRSRESDLINCTSIGKKTLSALISCSLTFVILDKRRETRPKSFFHRKDCPFFAKDCSFNNLLSLKELILLLPQKLSKHLPDRYNLIPDVRHVRYYEKNGQNFLCTGKFAFFQQPLRS